jgi:hypothetical protein
MIEPNLRCSGPGASDVVAIGASRAPGRYWVVSFRNMRTNALLLLLLATCVMAGCTNSHRTAHCAELPPPPEGESQAATKSVQQELPIPPGSVRIYYEVKQLGDYPCQPGMNVRDLVRQAGGLSDFASGIRVERSRTNLVNVYYGSPRRTGESKYMGTPLEPGDRVWIKRTDL